MNLLCFEQINLLKKGSELDYFIPCLALQNLKLTKIMKKFLVATDLSARSDRAVLRALKLAKEYKAHLTILHVVDEDMPRSLLDETKKIAKKEIAECIKGKTKDVDFEVKIISGIPSSHILKATAEEKIDLVILGLHRHTTDHQPMIGRVIERVVKSSMKPVLVVKNRSESKYKNILVGIDFNIHSKKSLKVALDLFADCNFNLVHSYYMPFLGASASLEAQVKANSSKDIDNMIKEAASGKSVKSYKIDKKIIKGDIIAILEDEIVYSKPDMLVLGTHGRSGLSRILSVNVTEHFLVNPASDVLVVS